MAFTAILEHVHIFAKLRATPRAHLFRCKNLVLLSSERS